LCFPFPSLSFPPPSSKSLSFIQSPFRLHSVFLPVPFPPSLSFRSIHSTCAQLSFSPHSTFSTFFLSFHPIPVFSLLIPTSESPHHFSFSCTLSPQVLQNFLCHTPLILPVVPRLSDSFPSLLLVRVFSLSLSSTFIHLHFALNLSTSSLAYAFLC
jgi:hypothetical protein